MSEYTTEEHSLQEDADNELNNQNLEKALEIYSQILEISPTNFIAKKHMGITLFEQGEYNKALEIFMELSKEKDYEAMYYLGLIKKESKKYVEAMQSICAAIALNRNHSPWLYIARGNLFSLQNKLSQAAKDYEKASDINSPLTFDFFNNYESNRYTFPFPPPEGCDPIAISKAESILSTAENLLAAKGTLAREFRSRKIPVKYLPLKDTNTGFAMVTEMEEYQLDSMGNPISSLSSLSRKELKPAYYRAFVLLISKDLVGTKRPFAPDKLVAQDWYDNGISMNLDSPSQLDKATLKSFSIHLLVYAYRIPMSTKNPEIIPLNNKETQLHLKEKGLIKLLLGPKAPKP